MTHQETQLSVDAAIKLLHKDLNRIWNKDDRRELLAALDKLAWEAKRGAEARAANTELQRLLVAHHAVGALENVLAGDICPVCERAQESHG